MMEQNNCINNNCSRCGSCCTPFLPMSKSEVNKIYQWLQKHPDIIQEAYDNNPIKDNNLYIRCCFYKDNKCLIYDVRPWICRAYKCNQNERDINANKNIASNKAFYNNQDIKTINDFRNLFFDDATLIIAGIMHFIPEAHKDINVLYKFVKDLERNDLIKYVERMMENGKGKL